MIFKLKIEGDQIDWAQAKSLLHLLKSYEEQYGSIQDIEEVNEVSKKEAKKIMLKNTDYDEDDPESPKEFSLFDTVVGDDFVIVGSTEFL
jgi:hypothetical protein